MDLEQAWQDFESIKYKSCDVSYNETSCSTCKANNIKIDDNQVTCMECGLVLSREYIMVNNVYEKQNIQMKSGRGEYSKIKRMEDWFMWSNEEKTSYKLNCYTQKFCKQLGIPEQYIANIINITTTVFSIIKQNYGMKRSKVKDGIILACIGIISKQIGLNMSYLDMTKTIGLDVKYVTRGEGFILELINAKKLKIDKDIVMKSHSPYQHVLDTIYKKGLNISDDILDKIKLLIEICEDNDILMDHTPMSIGVSCFYYVLKTMKHDIDIKIFSDINDISLVTVTKTYNKLKIYEKEFAKYNI